MSCEHVSLELRPKASETIGNVYTSEERLFQTVGIDWLIEQGLTSPPTQYRLYGQRFLQVRRPNQQYQSTEGTKTVGAQHENRRAAMFVDEGCADSRSDTDDLRTHDCLHGKTKQERYEGMKMGGTKIGRIGPMKQRQNIWTELSKDQCPTQNIIGHFGDDLPSPVSLDWCKTTKLLYKHHETEAWFRDLYTIQPGSILG